MYNCYSQSPSSAWSAGHEEVLVSRRLLVHADPEPTFHEVGPRFLVGNTDLLSFANLNTGIAKLDLPVRLGLQSTLVRRDRLQLSNIPPTAILLSAYRKGLSSQ